MGIDKHVSGGPAESFQDYQSEGGGVPISTEMFIPTSDGTERRSKGIIFKITDTNGHSSADHGPGLKGRIPRIVCYHCGTGKMISLTSIGRGVPFSDAVPESPDSEAR